MLSSIYLFYYTPIHTIKKELYLFLCCKCSSHNNLSFSVVNSFFLTFSKITFVLIVYVIPFGLVFMDERIFLGTRNKTSSPFVIVGHSLPQVFTAANLPCHTGYPFTPEFLNSFVLLIHKGAS